MGDSYTLKALANLFETNDLSIKELDYGGICDTCDLANWKYRFSLPMEEQIGQSKQES